MSNDRDRMTNVLLRPLVEDLHARRAQIRLGGGEEKIAPSTSEKLTARELALLIDEGTFVELGIHGRPHSSQRAMDGVNAPADGVITGYGKIDGRLTAVGGVRLHGDGRLDGHDGRTKGLRLRELALTKADPDRLATGFGGGPGPGGGGGRCSRAVDTCSGRRW